MFDNFNTKFNTVASEIHALATQKTVSHHVFYKLGTMIANLPLKSVRTEKQLEYWISNRNYDLAIRYLKAQNR